MGMFDELICDCPLPDNPPAFARESDHRFQTKDLACLGETHRISGEGLFDIADFTGDLHFYTSNQCGGWGEIVYTADGQDAESVEYVATIINGVVRQIKQTARTRKPALPREAMLSNRRPTEQEIAERKRRVSESLAGKTLYVQWGGLHEGYAALVVFEDAEQLCVKGQFGRLELLDRWARDNTFFDDENSAKESRAQRSAEYERAAKEYRDYAQSRLNENARQL